MTSPTYRWITPEGIAELIKRARTVLHRQGTDVQGIHSKVIRYAEFHGLTIKHYYDERVSIEDQVAAVITFDNDSDGVKECFGSTALNVLETLRANMVLDDIADA